jgi:nucleoside-diphosphate-sugar epimerase
MLEAEKSNRFIVVGKDGGFSEAMVSQLQNGKSENSIINLSTRALGTREYQNQIDAILASQREFNDMVIWCSGSASNRSNSEECSKDEVKLQKFMKDLLASSTHTFNVCYLSSGGTVYGQSPGTVNENSPLSPSTPYAEMKIRSENFLRQISRTGKIGVYIFRIANVYGFPHLKTRKSFVKTALENSEIHLSVNPESRKQYGTYQDYAKFILKYLEHYPLVPGFEITQNVFSEFNYSISEILDITRPYSAFQDRVITHDPGALSRYEEVLLTSINPWASFDFKWQNLEDYLREVDLGREQVQHPK